MRLQLELDDLSVQTRPYSTLIGHVFWRINNKFNFAMVLTGEPGIGKSDYALQIGLHVDRNLSIKNVLFDIHSIFRLIQTLPPGSVIIVDEAAVDVGNMEWATNFAKMLKIVSVTDRFKQIIVLFCLPNLNMLDVNQRRLINGILHIYYRGRAEFSKPVQSRTGEIVAMPLFVCDAQPLPETHWLRSQYDTVMIRNKNQVIRNAEIQATLMSGHKSLFDGDKFGEMSRTDIVGTDGGDGPEYEDDNNDDGFSEEEKRRIPKYERRSMQK